MQAKELEAFEKKTILMLNELEEKNEVKAANWIERFPKSDLLSLLIYEVISLQLGYHMRLTWTP